MSAKHRATVTFTPAQWRALAAPARQELVDVLETAGPCSVARLGALLGRPADALYHHLRRLVRAGLVAETARRREGRHVFAEYDLAVRPLHAARQAPVRSADVERVVGAAQRLAWRDFRRALAAADGEPGGPRRTLCGARARGWLTPAALARVNALLDEVLATLRAGGPGAGRIPVSLGILLAPLPADRTRRAARAAQVESRHGRSGPTRRSSSASRASRTASTRRRRRAPPPKKGRP